MIVLPAFLSNRFKSTQSASASFQFLNGGQQLLKTGRSIVGSFWPGIILSTALFSIACAAIFIVVAETDLSPTATVFNRLWIAAIAFGGWQLLSRWRWSATAQPTDHTYKPASSLHNQDLLLLLVASLSFTASLSCSAWSLTQTPVANSTLLNNMMPIFTTLGAWLILGQQFSRRFVFGLGVAILGVIAMGMQALQVAAEQLIGDALALLAAILLAAAILTTEQLRNRFSTPSIMAVVCLTGSVAIGPVLLLHQDQLFPAHWQSGLAVMGLAIVCQVMGHGFLTQSLKQFSSGFVAVAMLAIPIISAVLAMILFSQQFSLISSAAFAIVLLGIYLAISAPNAQTF